ncbi:restriction endonuclease subunit S [Pseudarthrobacter sp. ATCC 49987]|uniref:restriction endonuclease subunit S n=1 Tax=Pseudarthrobacter sp. ATCC 49987 TaxID=2698204 RepID=UPI001368A2DF|nr:restriction endonuclease subunit S [Pseudarthrobacter sp. ATCC 49987]
MTTIETLGQLIQEQGGSIKTGPFGTTLKANEYSETGVPIISVGEVGYGSLSLRRDTPCAPAEVTQRLPEYLLEPGDIVFGRKGAVDRCAWVKESENGWFLGSDGIRLRLPSSVDSRFVAYQFQDEATRAWLLQHASGSTMLSLNQKILERVPLQLPSIDTQRAIAEVLGALDDKIAANVQLSATTEEFLQASYRGLVQSSPSLPVPVETLVHRIPPKRKFAKEELLTQGDYPVFDQSDYGFLGYLNGEGFLEASADQPVMYFGDHTCKLRIAAQRFTVGPNTVPFVGSGIPTLTLYCALKGLQNHEEYKRHWQLLMKREVSVPDDQTSTAFALRHGHLLSVLKSVSQESACLAATRDALLPPLMSGKLRVKDSEKVLVDAGV